MVMLLPRLVAIRSEDLANQHHIWRRRLPPGYCPERASLVNHERRPNLIIITDLSLEPSPPARRD